MKKGQYFSFDAIIASVIFMMALVFLLSYWHSVKMYMSYQSSEISSEGLRIASLLFTPTYPKEAVLCSEMKNFGFALSWEDKKLDGELLKSCSSSSAEEIKRKLETPYDILIRVKYVNEKVEFYIGLKDVPEDAKEVIKIRRAATVLERGTTHLATIDIMLFRS